MAIKALEFGKEMRIRKMAIENADRVIRIKGNHKIAACIFDRLHVAGRNIAGSSDKGVRGHVIQSLFELKCPQPSKEAHSKGKDLERRSKAKGITEIRRRGAYYIERTASMISFDQD